MKGDGMKGDGMKLLVSKLLVPLLVVGLAACGDDDPATDIGSQTDTVDEPLVDVVEEPIPDTSVDEPDASVDPVVDAVEEADQGVPDVEEEPEACPGSISCYDQVRRQPRNEICVNAEFPPGTGCILQPGGAEACCVPPFMCESDADCESAREEEGFCVDVSFACTCNIEDGSCSTFLCFNDEECDGALVCRVGNCVEAGETSGLVARIVTPSGPITEGEELQLYAIAYDPDEASRVFTDIPITWSSDGPDSLSLNATGLATGGSVTGTVTITAEVTDNEDDTGSSIQLYNYADHAETLRVIVLDEFARSPIVDAPVLIDDGATVVELTTLPTGEAISDDELSFPVDIHVVHPDYGYVSFIDVEVDDILAALPPTTYSDIRDISDDDVAEDAICEEVTGETLCYDLEGLAAILGVPDYSNVSKPGEIDVALTGFGMGNDLLDMRFETIVGPNIRRDLSEGPIPMDGISEMPGGVAISILDDPMIPSYVLTSPPGERTLWTMGGHVSLSENPTLLPEIIEQFSGDTDIGTIVAIILPVFKDFSVGIADFTVELEEGGLSLTRLDTEFTVPMSRELLLDAPLVPLSETRPLETGLFLAGAYVPGLGFHPLGVTAAVDNGGGTPMDGQLDGDVDTVEIDPIQMNMAPIHGEIVGPETHYLLVAVALGLGDPPPGQPELENATAILYRTPPGELPPAELTLDSASFPDVPVGSTWNDETQVVSVDPIEGVEIDFYRLVLEGDNGRKWWINLPADIENYTVPDLSTVESWENRADADRIWVVSLELLDGDDSVSYENLLSPAGPSSLDLIRFVEQFSRLEL